MLSDIEIDSHLATLHLPSAGNEYVHRVRQSPPSRNVSSSGARNTTWRYASQKMGCTIQGESTLERNFLVRCEYADDVVEFWDQPETVSVTYPGRGGRTQRVSYTADVLVLESNKVTAYQVKRKEQCALLVKQRPGRWKLSDDRYVDEAANAAFEPLGLQHVVVTEDDISAVAAENYSLLLQARRNAATPDLDTTARIRSIFAEEGVLAIADLLRRLGEQDATPVLQLIDLGQIFALLDQHRLADIEDALIGLDSKAVQEVATTRLALLNSPCRDGIPHTEAPSLGQINALVFRLGQLKAPEKSTVSKKTMGRWRKSLEAAHGDIRSLIPQTHRRGNRIRRLDQTNLDLLHQAITSKLLVPNPCTTTSAYCTYVNLHKVRFAETGSGLHAPPKPATLPTFFEEVRRIPLAIRYRAQGGSRLENAFAPPIDPKVRSLTPLRPFERAHIDHYLSDHHLVVLVTGKRILLTKRAWLTVMIDQATKVVIALSISFYSPSRRACACVIRDCVGRHGRLPETIVVDHGPEFESTYFEVLLARYGVTKHERPPHDPRFGGDIESAFHSIHEELLRSLQGSTSNDARGRAISPSHRGQALACWKLRDAYLAYEHYFTHHFNLKVRGTNVCAANCLFEDMLESFPVSGMPVSHDEAFRIATCFPLSDLYTVSHNRGITHNGRWYFHTGLLRVPNGANVSVLEDPWDDGLLYASVGDKWVPCLSSPNQTAHGSPELQMFRSIVSLETQAIRREEAMAGRVALEADVTRMRSAPVDSDKAQKNLPEGVKARGSSHPRLPSPSKVKPQPYATYQGDFHGHSKRR